MRGGGDNAGEEVSCKAISDCNDSS
jgi:hypothetical protein